MYSCMGVNKLIIQELGRSSETCLQMETIKNLGSVML